jgi:molybdate transport system substrate-binding protein
MSRRNALLIPLLLAAGMLVGCGGGASTPLGASGSSQVHGDVTVFAAASLTEAFKEIAGAFEAQYPGVNVVFNFAGTPTLRAQLEQGARADVFASANPEQMDLAVSGGLTDGTVSTFARNSLVIITPSDNPAGIKAPSDLARDGLKLVFAQEDVPVGDYTKQSLTKMDDSGEFGAGFSRKVLDNVVSQESNVKQVVAKVELGEADAGIVYGTDVTPDVAPSLRKVEIPQRFNVVASYPIALVKDRQNDIAGRAFIDFVLSEAGQTILLKHGFLSAG